MDKSNQINEILSSPRISLKQLEILLGRQNHVASITHMIRHFLGRLRHAFMRSVLNGWTSLRLGEKKDLHLLSSFLDLAIKGLSIGNLVYRKPMHLYCSDASEFGFRGYNLVSGNAWRFELPVHLRLRTSLNDLEFLACVITIWLDILLVIYPREA